MTLVESWIDSVQLLKPKNMQLFIMVTIKSVIETYKLLCKYFWWLMVSLISFQVLSVVYQPFFVALDLYAAIYLALSLFLPELLFFAVCTATRPSVVKKDCAYFRSQMKVFFYIIMFYLISAPLLFLLNKVVPAYIIGFFVPIATIKIFFVLFLLDSSKKMKDFFGAYGNALKMLGYNYPLILVFGMASTILGFAYQAIIVWFLQSSMMPSSMVAMMIVTCATIIGLLVVSPVAICLYANVYIKKLHDQFDLYIKQPQ